MAAEEGLVLTGYITNSVNLFDKLSSISNFDFEGIKNGIDMIEKINEQINIIDTNPFEYNTEIYDDIISYNNEAMQNSRELKNKRESKRREIKQNNKRLSEQKKFAQQQLSELKKQRSVLNKSRSNITKLNTKSNNKFNFNQGNRNTEPLIKKKQNQIIEADKKEREINERRAEILYGDENYTPSPNTFYLRAEKNNQSNISDFKRENTNNKTPDISNAEKTLFPKGTLAEMPLIKEPLEDVKRDMEKEKERIIRDIEEKEIDTDTLGTIKLKEVIPNIEEYIPPIKTKDEKRAEIIYKDMKVNSKKDLIKDYGMLESDLRVINWGLMRLEEEINKKLASENKEEIKVIESLGKLNLIDFIKEVIKIKNNWSVIRSSVNPKTVFAPYLDKNDTTIDDIKMLELEQALQNYINGGILTEFLADTAAKMPDAASVLRISSKEPIKRTKHLEFAEIYNSSDELPKKYKNIIKEKLDSQHIDINAGGVYFYPNSGFAQRIIESNELKNKIKEIFDKIPQFYDKKNIKNNLSNSSLKFPNDNLYYALNKADIKNLMFTPDGDISGDIIDTTDFNVKEKQKLLQAGHELQEFGRIKPKFLIIHFVLPKEKVNEIKQEINNEINK